MLIKIRVASCGATGSNYLPSACTSSLPRTAKWTWPSRCPPASRRPAGGATMVSQPRWRLGLGPHTLSSQEGKRHRATQDRLSGSLAGSAHGERVEGGRATYTGLREFFPGSSKAHGCVHVQGQGQRRNGPRVPHRTNGPWHLSKPASLSPSLLPLLPFHLAGGHGSPRPGLGSGALAGWH